ncbi:hypothetical protein EJ110_NYTH07836 [Nymphaea thermarum]|nr:hypothetical protein EJ110_NYTH07836 [Nymphaea thermarum]
MKHFRALGLLLLALLVIFNIMNLIKLVHVTTRPTLTLSSAPVYLFNKLKYKGNVQWRRWFKEQKQSGAHGGAEPEQLQPLKLQQQCLQKYNGNGVCQPNATGGRYRCACFYNC